MQELFQSYANLMSTPAKFAAALEAGRLAVVHEVGEAADSYLQSAIPAYGVAVSACAQADVAIDCTETRIRLRDTGLNELVSLVGLGAIIDAAVDLWHAIPAAVRAIAIRGAATAQAWADALKDPSIGSVVAAIGVTAELASEIIGPVADKVMEIAEDGTKAAAWLVSKGSAAVEAVAAELFQAGYEAIAVAVESALDLGKDVLTLLKDGTLTPLFKVINGGPEAVLEVLGDLGGSLVEGGEAVIGAVEDTLGAINPFNW